MTGDLEAPSERRGRYVAVGAYTYPFTMLIDDPLAGLSPQEKFAAVVVSDALGAQAFANDVGGRQGAIDVLLIYPDGRQAGLEVTSQAGEGVQQRNALTRTRVPNPGRWTWRISIGSVRDLPELLKRYSAIIEASEALGISHPSRLYTRNLPSPDFEWLMGSTVTMSGMPNLAANSRPDRQWIRIVPHSDGGGVDIDLVGLPEAIRKILDMPNQIRHVEKLGASGLQETHLFIALDEGSLPFAQRAALFGNPSVHPVGRLDLPEALHYVWFVADFSHTLYGYGQGNWRVLPIESTIT